MQQWQPAHQATIFTMSSPMTIVRLESIVALWKVPLKSMETSGESLTTRMSFIGPFAASRNAWLTSSANVFFSVCARAAGSSLAESECGE